MATKGDISGLDTLQFGGVPKIPMLQGITKAKRSGVRQSNAQGGLTRQRKKFYGNPWVADATFMLKTLPEIDYFTMFGERNEGKKFICYMRADRPIIEPYVVQVISEWPDTLIARKSARATVTMEIYPARDPCLDEFIFPMYECSGNDLYCILDGIIEVAKGAPSA